MRPSRRYDQILDDLDDDKDLTFAYIQTICARQFQRPKERPDTPHRAETAETPRATTRTSPAKPEKYNKYKRQGGNEHVALLCITLEKHGEQSDKILRRSSLAGADWNESASVTALFMDSQKYITCSIPSDTDNNECSGDTDYDAASAYESDDTP